MKRGVYIGPEERLKGKTALVRYEDERQVKVQFDDQHLLVDENKPSKDITNRYGFGWHLFQTVHFKIMES